MIRLFLNYNLNSHLFSKLLQMTLLTYVLQVKIKAPLTLVGILYIGSTYRKFMSVWTKKIHQILQDVTVITKQKSFLVNILA